VTACGARIAWWRCLAAFVVVVGIVLSPLRAAAATAPMLIAHDAAAWPTATMQAETGAAVRSDERGSAPEYVYDDARDRYDGTTTRRVIDAAGGVRAYDHALNLAEQREVAEGVIYAASAAAPAAEGVEGIALREGESAASGMQAHHIFPQQMAEQFEAGGVNIEEFRVQLSEGTHLGQLHSSGGIPGVGPGGLWNETWRQYLAGEAAAGRALTPQGLMGQAAQMLGDFNVPYYSPLPGP
jgi:hypothetical protein